MAKTEIGKKTVVQTKTPSNLRGTLTAVFILGFFLIFTWVGVFLLFLNRL
ncbi:MULTISPECIES: cytochrome c oxidase subunit 2A [Bacillus]|nr:MULTISPECIES: cytochrome c oxidase subunit 2A [Bacillus]